MNRTRLSIIWHFLLIVSIAAIGYALRNKLSFNDIEPLISILQNTSAMIFTIMGIWIAYVYPNAVLSIVQPSKVAAVFSEEDLERVKLLVGVVILSAFILALLIIGVSARMLIAKTDMFLRNRELFSGIGIFFVLIITYAQLFCMYAVIASSVNFIIDLKNLRTRQRLAKKLDGKNKTD